MHERGGKEGLSNSDIEAILNLAKGTTVATKKYPNEKYDFYFCVEGVGKVGVGLQQHNRLDRLKRPDEHS